MNFAWLGNKSWRFISHLNIFILDKHPNGKFRPWRRNIAGNFRVAFLLITYYRYLWATSLHFISLAEAEQRSRLASFHSFLKCGFRWPSYRQQYYAWQQQCCISVGEMASCIYHLSPANTLPRSVHLCISHWLVQVVGTWEQCHDDE